MAARNYLDPQAWRSDMDAPSPNYLSPATLKPGPAPTGYGLGAAATRPGEDTR